MTLARRLLFLVVQLLATVQVVWFYLTQVPSYLVLDQYERGLVAMPFQGRLLMMVLLRWAHRYGPLIAISRSLSSMSAWFPKPVRPEDLAEAGIDLLAVAVTGLVARSLYRAASRERLLSPVIYPLTLVMFASTYGLSTFHRMRFPYDLPSVGLFSLGMAILYFGRSQILFSLLFIVATINRETSLFLLVLLPLRECIALSLLWMRGSRWSRGKRLLGRVWIVLPLLLYWVGWHLWVAHLYRGDRTEAGPRLWLNVGTFLWPFAWPQLLSAFAFCLPLCVVFRRSVEDRTLRLWQVVVPLWLAVMLRYGLYVETRIFGELIPLLAASTGLILEAMLEQRLRAGGQMQTDAAKGLPTGSTPEFGSTPALGSTRE